MGHQLDETTGTAALAFTGDRKQIWHGLGTEMTDDATIEQWIENARLDWEVKAADVSYDALTTAGLAKITYGDRKVLYRSDTAAPLSVVSKDFKVVQPREVVEFFRGLVESNGMKLNTAGSLFGGRRFWALAELGKEDQIVEDDVVKGYLLLTTAVDGSLRTTGKFVAERPVCNNTITIALNETSRSVVAVSHRSEWDPDKVKVDLGLMDEAWYDFITNMRKLASTKVSADAARDFYERLIFDPKREEPARAEIRKVDKLLDLYKNGAGHELGSGTLWNVLNGATELFTHGNGRKEESAQFWDSQIAGLQNTLKSKAMAQALAMV